MKIMDKDCEMKTIFLIISFSFMICSCDYTIVLRLNRHIKQKLYGIQIYTAIIMLHIPLIMILFISMNGLPDINTPIFIH